MKLKFFLGEVSKRTRTVLLLILLWIETFTAAIIMLILCAKICKMALLLVSELWEGNKVCKNAV